MSIASAVAPHSLLAIDVDHEVTDRVANAKDDGWPPPPGFAPWPDGEPRTDFQRAVVAVVAGLGPGDLTTYGEVAAEAGRPGAGQAVANVLRSAAGLPWWRVLPGEGRVYRTHAPAQVPLLEAEGHVVDEHRRVHPADG